MKCEEFFLSGIVLPFIISIVVLITVKGFNILWFKITYRKLNNKTFQTFWKNEIGGSPIQEYKLILKSSSISYTGKHLAEEGSTFKGVIKFEPSMKGFGKGYSIKNTTTIDGFNFFTIYFEENLEKAFQEASYVKSPAQVADRKIVPEAYVWRLKTEKKTVANKVLLY